MKRPFKNATETLRELLALRRNGYSGPFFLGAMLFGMGVWLALPVDTFSTAQEYAFMKEHASEEMWAGTFIFTSAVMLGSALARRPREVALAALVCAGIWLMIFASFTASNPASTMIPLTFVLFLRALSIHQEFKHHFDPITGKPYLAAHHNASLCAECPVRSQYGGVEDPANGR